MSKEYTNKFEVDFGENGQNLFPVVTQNAQTKEVLILSYLNKQAYEASLKNGYATYWSRSRNELWQKGLTSGDLLKIIEIRINCEQNSFLFLVEPEGDGACHAKNDLGKAYSSCYYRTVFPDGSLLKNQ